MNNFEKIATVNIEVPHRSAGNAIKNKRMNFDVYKDEAWFKAIPLCREDERIVANLPPELTFAYQQGKVQSERGPREGNTHIMTRIVDELKKQQLIN